jgi:hypothetical protein
MFRAVGLQFAKVQTGRHFHPGQDELPDSREVALMTTDALHQRSRFLPPRRTFSLAREVK